MKHYLRVLTIAGSDSSGGAGIQADLKTFSALKCYGMSAITALTAQNTTEVRSIFPVDPIFVKEQLEAILDDVGVDTVKIGMLNTSEIISVVTETLKKYHITKIVIDPVMISTSGNKLISDGAIETLKKEILPLATIITPNIPEAEVLSGIKIDSLSSMKKAGEILLASGLQSILIKGGHLNSTQCTDIFLSPYKYMKLEQKRINTPNTHGTGCTLSAAIAAFLAKGFSPSQASRRAVKYLYRAIKAGARYQIGEGHGPVKHFY